MNASAQCPHVDLDFDINVQVMADSNIHYLEISGRCKTCGKRMIFRGLPLGVSPHRPTCDLIGYQACLPFLAEGEDMIGTDVGFVGRPVAVG